MFGSLGAIVVVFKIASKQKTERKKLPTDAAKT
jgi:hypothetical protein